MCEVHPNSTLGILVVRRPREAGEKRLRRTVESSAGKPYALRLGADPDEYAAPASAESIQQCRGQPERVNTVRADRVLYGRRRQRMQTARSFRIGRVHADREDRAFDGVLLERRHQLTDIARVPLIAHHRRATERIPGALELPPIAAGDEHGRARPRQQLARAGKADSFARTGDEDHQAALPTSPQRTSWIAPAKPAPTAPSHTHVSRASRPAATASERAIGTDAEVVLAQVGKLIQVRASGIARSHRICLTRKRFG